LFKINKLIRFLEVNSRVKVTQTEEQNQFHAKAKTKILVFAFLFVAVIAKSIHVYMSVAVAEVSQITFSNSFEADFVQAAINRTKHQVRYDGSYKAISYPNGDVPANIGVCTDVIIRSYRAIGVDLQKLVHEDMQQNFNHYPSKRIWGLNKTDKNIDHRRVPNLQAFFARYGQQLKITSNKQDYAPGDIVTWLTPGNLPHIGIVTNRISPSSGNPLIAHNMGAGPRLDDMLFDFDISGHYRYVPKVYRDVL